MRDNEQRLRAAVGVLASLTRAQRAAVIEILKMGRGAMHDTAAFLFIAAPLDPTSLERTRRLLIEAMAQRAEGLDRLPGDS